MQTQTEHQYPTSPSKRQKVDQILDVLRQSQLTQKDNYLHKELEREVAKLQRDVAYSENCNASLRVNSFSLFRTEKDKEVFILERERCEEAEAG